MRRPTAINLESNGHWFEFQLTHLGHLRCVAVDGKWNDRRNSRREHVSETAWTQAWDKARLRVVEIQRESAARDQQIAQWLKNARETGKSAFVQALRELELKREGRPL